MTPPRLHPPHAVALAPRPSLLRLSAVQRLVGAGVIGAVLWAAVLAVIGW